LCVRILVQEPIIILNWNLKKPKIFENQNQNTTINACNNCAIPRLAGPSIIDRGLARCLDCQMCAHVKVKANFKERKKTLVL
jgi:flavoprotein